MHCRDHYLLREEMRAAKVRRDWEDRRIVDQGTESQRGSQPAVRRDIGESFDRLAKMDARPGSAP